MRVEPTKEERNLSVLHQIDPTAHVIEQGGVYTLVTRARPATGKFTTMDTNLDSLIHTAVFVLSFSAVIDGVEYRFRLGWHQPGDKDHWVTNEEWAKGRVS